MHTKAFNCVLAAAAALSVGSLFATPVRAVVIDDFNTTASPSAYTRYTVLDSDATAESTISSPAGGLTVTRTGAGTAPTGPEQSLYLRPLTVGVGQQLRVDFANAASTVYADFGIAIAGPQTNVAYNTTTGGNQSTRSNFVAVYGNPNQALVKTIAFDGATQTTGNPAAVPIANITAFYITHTSASQFVTGYTLNGVDTNFGTYNLTAANAATFTNVGFFSDLRAVGTNGTLDNLSVVNVPEPTSVAALALGGLVALRRRRA